MGRFFLILVLAAAACTGAAWYFGLLEPGSPARVGDPNHPSVAEKELGGPLYEHFKVVQTAINDGLGGRPEKRRPKILVIHDCHLSAYLRSEISSAKDGVLLFIGKEVTEDSAQGKSALPTVPVRVGDNRYDKAYWRWKEGDIIEFDEMLALVDPSQALNDQMKNRYKIEVAEAEHNAAIAMANEARARVTRLERMTASGPKGIVPEEEYAAAVLTRVKYIEDAVSKQKLLDLAKVEHAYAAAVARQHEIRNVLPGKSVIRAIYKNMGEGVKNFDVVMRLENLSRLKVEGLADPQDFDVLRETFDRLPADHRREKLRIIIEPSQEMGHEALNKAHRAEINAVAVCADGRFVSASEDKSACVWRHAGSASPEAVLRHSSPVRSVACTVRDKKSWCLTGCANGSISLWDLDDPKKPARVWQGEQAGHKDAVTALAFSADGQFFASGGQDSAIVLWKPFADEKADAKLYAFDDNPHQGIVTALYFTPKCQLISAGKDNTLRVWSLHEKGAKLEGEPESGRGGAVTMPGVSADGERMVFDQGRTLQVISTDPQRRTLAELKNPPSATAFETLALFSPDGSMLLTAGGAEGRMQLWRSPDENSRGYELRQFVNRDRSPTTCAAFSPDGKFLVSGTKEGYVHLWLLPDAKELKAHRIHTDSQNYPLTLENVDRSLEAGKVRLTASVQNPEVQGFSQGRLAPGRRVTIVVELDQ